MVVLPRRSRAIWLKNGVGKLHAFAVEAVGPLGLLINNASIYEGGRCR